MAINPDDYFLGQERFDKVMHRWVDQARTQLHDSLKEQHIYPYDEVWPGWKKENKRRAASGDPNAWYSTGKTARETNVVLVNDSMDDAVIEFRSTMGLWYAEMGVGLTGKKHVRGRRASHGRKRIEVQRDRMKKGSAKKRYVDVWQPMKGHTHRPSLRREMNLLKKRLNWAALQMHRQKFVWFMAYQIADMLSFKSGDYIYQVENWEWSQKQERESAM